MDTGPELHSQSASMHTEPDADLQPAKKHTDLEFGTQLPPEMHNDPKPQLLAVPMHSDPEPAQDPVQEEALDTSAAKPGGYLVAPVSANTPMGVTLFKILITL